jgi:hypothetical protein
VAPVSLSTDDQTSTNIVRTELENSRRPIRVGLLLDDQFAPRWIHGIIEQLLCAEPTELVVVVLSGKPPVRRLRPRSILFTLWRMFDKWKFSDDDDPLAPELKTYPVQTITLMLVDGMGKRTLSHTDVARLRKCNLDVLVQLGSGDLPDGSLTCAKYGVWVFHCGGYTKAETEPALFWSLYAGRSTYELVLHAATGDLRRDQVLYRSILPNHLFSLQRNLTIDCRRRAAILLQRLSDLYHRGWGSVVLEDMDGDTVEAPHPASLSRVMPRFIASLFVHSLRHLFERLCFREQWFLAYCKTSSPADTEQTRSTPLTVVVPPRGQNYADPFLFEHNGKRYIFFEEFADDGPGTICCAELHGDGTLGDTQPVLTRNYHLSYPFVFEWHGDIYLLPETWDNKTVEVYGAVDFPQRWELAGVLLTKVTAVDPTILKHNGRLWLFAAGLGGLGTELSELSLFFSDSLFGEWRPHPKNPVVCDIRRARPAGSLFFQRDLLIRPAQDCSERYGHAISFNNVTVLSETDYSEVTLRTILPNWMPRVCGTHTFNQQGGFRVLDGRMLVPRWAPIECNLRAFLDGSRFRGVTGRQPTPVLTRRKPLMETPRVVPRALGCRH